MKTTYGRKRDTRREAQKRAGDRRQLVRLLVCLSVFLVVFIGKEVFPSKVAETGKQLLAVIRANTDFRAALADLGRALEQEDSVLGEFGEFCVSVFAHTSQERTDASDSSRSEEDQEIISDSNSLNQLSDISAQADTDAQPTLLRVGDVVQDMDYQGKELPEGYSAQWLFLGEMETVTPVQGTVTSPFGYRDHPTIGRNAVHGGVDIAAASGTPVAAFSAGTVASLGESEDFGLWLQLLHPNGVSTFYSHCSKLCVEKGEQVKSGQIVACVGSTGNSTGPHLHFEIKLNDVRLDPMFYIEPSCSV